MTALLHIGAGALASAHGKLARAAETIARDPAGDAAQTHAIVQMVEAKAEAKAAASVIKTSDDMAGVLLDILS